MYLSTDVQELQIVLAGAVATHECDFSGMYMDSIRDANYLGIQVTGHSNGATPVIAVPPPKASTGRDIKEFFFYNRDTANVIVTLQYFNGTTTTIIKKTTLTPGQTLTYQDFFGWQVN